MKEKHLYILKARQSAKFSSIWERSGGSGGGDGGVRADLQAWPLRLSWAGVSAALRQFTHAGRLRAGVTAVDDECDCSTHTALWIWNHLQWFGQRQRHRCWRNLKTAVNISSALTCKHFLKMQSPFRPLEARNASDLVHQSWVTITQVQMNKSQDLYFLLCLLFSWFPGYFGLFPKTTLKYVWFCGLVFSTYVIVRNWSLHHLHIPG